MRYQIVVIIGLVLLCNGAYSQTVKEITAVEFQKVFEKMDSDKLTIIDGRDSTMFHSGHIKGAINIDAYAEDANEKLLSYIVKPKILVYCTNYKRSETIIDKLKTLEYNGEVYFVTDGITGWKSNGLPTITENVLNEKPISEPEQVFIPTGKPIVQVFGYSIFDATPDAKQPVSFGITRAHFGYQYNFSKEFMAAVIADLAGRATTTDFTVTDTSGQQLTVTNNGKEGSYYTAFLKFAYIQWKPSDKLTLQMGGILQNHYITQEKFWGYRYIYETFQDKYFGTASGDFGAIGYYKINNVISIDLAVTNGEGIRFKQDNFGKVKIASGINIKPVKGLITRLYYDNTATGDTLNNATQHLFSFFTGYQLDNLFRIGADINFRVNNQNYANRNFGGYSFFGTYIIDPKFEIFARFDNVISNTLSGQPESWNLAKEGKAYIAGIQYQPVKTVNFSINYQAWNVKEKIRKTSHYIMLNTEFKF